MLLPRSEGRDSFFRNDALRVTPGGGEATRTSLSCDDTVATDPCRRTKLHPCGAEGSCIVPRGTLGEGGIDEEVGEDELGNS
jgi:hypothetical protein